MPWPRVIGFPQSRSSKLANSKLAFVLESAEFPISSFEFRDFLPWAAAALSGLLLVACFPKIHLRGLVWVACLPLLVALAGEKRLKRAFLLGYVCGAFFFAGSCYWFMTVMEFYGHLAPALAVVVLILFVIIDSTFFGGFGLAMGWAARRSSGWALALSPFLWMAMELARTYLITGFPWNLLGYAVQASGVRQIASVTGVYGLSFLAVATSALLAWVLLSPRRARAGLALAGWVVLLLLAQWRLAPPPRSRGQGAGDSRPTERALGRCGAGGLGSLARPHPTSATRSVQRRRPWSNARTPNRRILAGARPSPHLQSEIQNRKSKIRRPIRRC